jgi:hypothetical protein
MIGRALGHRRNHSSTAFSGEVWCLASGHVGQSKPAGLCGPTGNRRASSGTEQAVWHQLLSQVRRAERLVVQWWGTEHRNACKERQPA